MPAKNPIFTNLNHSPLGVYTLDEGGYPLFVKSLSLLCPYAVTDTRTRVIAHMNDALGPVNTAHGDESRFRSSLPIHRAIPPRSDHATVARKTALNRSFASRDRASHSCMFHGHSQNSQSRPSINMAPIALRMWR
jgi:hypothetical protein